MTAAQAPDAMTAELEELAPRTSRWRRAAYLIRDNPLGVFGLLVVILLAAAAVLAPWVAPFAPDDIGAGPVRADPSFDQAETLHSAGSITYLITQRLRL